MSARRDVIRAADLFCGGGGTSTGLVQACQAAGREVHLVAVNHWQRAVDTHEANFPWAKHYCARIDQLTPRDVCPDGLDILVASPECVHHSRARGGKPMNDQSRASGWDVLRWVEHLEPSVVLLENVIEWEDWGPLNRATGRPIEARKGETFNAFIASLRSLNYRVEWRVLNAADFGDATTRRRLFVQARRGTARITWPTPSHTEDPTPLFGGPRWRPASDVIDWRLEGRSVFGRKKSLSVNTLWRIADGLRRFGSPAIAEAFKFHMRLVEGPLPESVVDGRGWPLDVEPQAFVQHITHGGRVHSSADPLPTVTGAKRGELAVVEPFVCSAGGPDVAAQPTSGPLNTVLTRDHMALTEPAFLVQVNHGHNPPESGRGNASRVLPVDAPVPGISAGGVGVGVARPFILAPLGVGRGNAPRSADKPMPTATASRGGGHLAEPFLTRYHGSHAGRSDGDGRVQPTADPVPCIDTSNRVGLAEPCLVILQNNNTPKGVERPVPTVTAQGNKIGLLEPAFLLSQDGRGAPRSAAEPAPTIVAKGAVGLCNPFVVPQFGEAKPKDVAEPLGVVTATSRGIGLVQPFLIPFYGTGVAQSIDAPLPTATTKDRFALVETLWLDVRFRMLQPRELSAAMGFPATYVFQGNREETVRMVGNAVAVGIARALCASALALEAVA